MKKIILIKKTAIKNNDNKTNKQIVKTIIKTSKNLNNKNEQTKKSK